MTGWSIKMSFLLIYDFILFFDTLSLVSVGISVGGLLVLSCMKCWWDIHLSIQMSRCRLVGR